MADTNLCINQRKKIKMLSNRWGLICQTLALPQRLNGLGFQQDLVPKYLAKPFAPAAKLACCYPSRVKFYANKLNELQICTDSSASGKVQPYRLLAMLTWHQNPIVISGLCNYMPYLLVYNSCQKPNSFCMCERNQAIPIGGKESKVDAQGARHSVLQ